MTIIEQLTSIYHNLEHWHKAKLSVEQADEYHERLLLNGNIITYVVKDELIGYLEFWRLTHTQFGRLVCGIPILTDKENLLNGPIVVINNMYIKEGERYGEAFTMLSAMFLSRNKDAKFYVAFRRVKRNQPIQVYTKEEILKHFKRS